MPSGAGLNRYGRAGGVVQLNLNSGLTAVSTPLTAYGTIGSTDTGPIAFEAIGFSKWLAQLYSTDGNAFSGYSVSIYGTIDPRAYAAWEYTINPNLYYGNVPPACPATSWFLLPGPSEQSGTGSMGNPLTVTTPVLYTSLPLEAVRAVLTATSQPSGNATLALMAVP